VNDYQLKAAMHHSDANVQDEIQDGLAVASKAPNVVVEMTPSRDNNAW